MPHPWCRVLSGVHAADAAPLDGKSTRPARQGSNAAFGKSQASVGAASAHIHKAPSPFPSFLAPNTPPTFSCFTGELVAIDELFGKNSKQYRYCQRQNTDNILQHTTSETSKSVKTALTTLQLEIRILSLCPPKVTNWTVDLSLAY